MTLPITFGGAAGLTIQAADAGWTRSNGTGNVVITAAGRARQQDTAACEYRWTADSPPGAAYWVEADLLADSYTTSQRIGICGRMATGARTMYVARLNIGGGSTGDIELYRFVAGTATPLGTPYTVTVSGDPTFRVRLDMAAPDVNGHCVITVSVDGTPRITYTDTTPILGAGSIGIYAGAASGVALSDAAGVHVDNITTSFAGAVDVTAPTLSGSITVDAFTHNSITISHPAGADDVAVSGYEYSCDTGTPSWNYVAGANAPRAFTGLTAETEYTLRVRARDAAGNVSAAPLTGTQTTDTAPVSVSRRGVRIALFDGSTPWAGLSGIGVTWWDSATPAGAPAHESIGSADASGVITVDLEDDTSLAIAADGFLLLHKPHGSDPQQSLSFAGQLAVMDIG